MTKGPRETIRKRMNFYRSQKFLDEVKAVLFVGADLVRAEAHRSISTGGVTGKNHIPSRPGEPPNWDSGHLAEHIEHSQPEPFTARVTSFASYSAALEFGTSKIAARPFMRPARDKITPEVKRTMRRRINRAARKYGISN